MGCTINGREFSDGDPTLKLISDILYGRNWSNEETAAELYNDGLLVCTIDTVVNDAHRIIYIYADGTIEWFDTQDILADNHEIHRYRDVDGDADPMYFNLKQVPGVDPIGEIDRIKD